MVSSAGAEAIPGIAEPMTVAPSVAFQSSTDRRRRRIERELRALRAMSGHLRTREIAWAVIAIPLLALLCFLVAAKLQWLAGSLPLSVLGAVAAGAAIWWIGRRWFLLAALIVYGLLLVLLESGDLDLDGGEDRKRDRRHKLDRAIAKREAMLRTMGETRPGETAP